MPHDAKTDTLSGQLQQLLFSPKGEIEGLMMMMMGSKQIQVSMHPASAAEARALTKAVGKSIEVKGLADHSSKTKEGVHPVYKLNVITKISGTAVKSNGDAHPISGLVATIRYAKYGEPNGVILESGEFIHTHPDGMKELKLEVGSKVIAHGESRMTVLGTPLIEAREVNRVTLE